MKLATYQKDNSDLSWGFILKLNDIEYLFEPQEVV